MENQPNGIDASTHGIQSGHTARSFHEHFTDFVEIHGTGDMRMIRRWSADLRGLMGKIWSSGSKRAAIQSRQMRNFGMQSPKATAKLACMQLARSSAARSSRFIDTPGAYPESTPKSVDRPKRSRSTFARWQVSFPIVGRGREGGSGGALAIGIATVC